MDPTWICWNGNILKGYKGLQCGCFRYIHGVSEKMSVNSNKENNFINRHIFFHTLYAISAMVLHIIQPVSLHTIQKL